MRRSIGFVAALCFTVAATVASAADAPPLKIAATLGVQGAFKDIEPMLVARSGIPVNSQFLATVPLVEKLLKGEPADLVILTKAAIEDLAAKGRVVPGSQVDLVVSQVALAVADGAPIPPMKTKEDFIALIKSTPSLAHSAQGGSGIHIAKLIKDLGLSEIAGPKTTVVPEGFTGTLLLNGKVAVAFQQVSELRASGAKNIVPLPDALQARLIFTAAVMTDTKRAKDAEAIVKLLTSADASAAYKRSGLEPVFKAK